jgi:hypothetical protein
MRRAQYQRIICTLVARGTWFRLDALYLLAAESPKAALTNLISASYGLTVNGACLFGANAGYMGDARSCYLNTGFTPGVGRGNFSLTGASLGVGITDPRQEPEQWVAIGTSNWRSSGSAFIAPIRTDVGPASMVGPISGPSKVNYRGSTAANGAWIVNYTGSRKFNLYKNSRILDSTRIWHVNFSRNPVLIGAYYERGSIKGYSADSFSWAFIGGHLNREDIATLTSLLSTFPKNRAGVPAAHWGFTKSTFNYDFSTRRLSGVDVNATFRPGYSFYPSFYFGAGHTSRRDFSFRGGLVIMGGRHRGRIVTRGDTSSAFTGTVAGTTLAVISVLYGPITIGQVIAGNSAFSGQTIVSQLSGTPGGVGAYQLSAPVMITTSSKLEGNSSVGIKPFPPGGYYEATFTSNPANDVKNDTFPSFWIADLRGLYASNIDAGFGQAAHFLELDIWEGVSGSRAADMNAFDWTLMNGDGAGTSNSVRQNYANVTNATAPHEYGMLWVPSTLNHGMGLIQFYLDGVLLPKPITYSFATGASPSCAPSNPNGCLFVGEGGSFVLLFDSGGDRFHAYPIGLESVNVWH